MGRPVGKPRPIRVEGDVAYVPLTRGYEAVIDAADAHLVDGYSWCALPRPDQRTVYAIRRACCVGQGKRPTIYLHREIMKPKDGQYVDHINHDGLDCRRANMRFCTRVQNSRNARLSSNNTSGYKGVGWHSQSSKWRASIHVNSKRLSLGLFDCKHKAHAAYVKAAEKHFGDFACPG